MVHAAVASPGAKFLELVGPSDPVPQIATTGGAGTAIGAIAQFGACLAGFITALALRWGGYRIVSAV